MSTAERPADESPTPGRGLADAVWALVGATKRSRARRPGAGGGHGDGEVRVLGHLHVLQESATMGELARAAGLNPASTTATVDRLEDEGLVVRVRDEDDGRIRRVALTPEGRDAVSGRLAAWEAEWSDALTDIPEADLVVTTRTLLAVAAVVEAR